MFRQDSLSALPTCQVIVTKTYKYSSNCKKNNTKEERPYGRSSVLSRLMFIRFVGLLEVSVKETADIEYLLFDLIIPFKPTFTASVGNRIMPQSASKQFMEEPIRANPKTAISGWNSCFKRIYIFSPRPRPSTFGAFLWNAVWNSIHPG